ncbi:MAG: DNA gyrase inhibitor YacG [Thiotrichaceae bacterium]|nr:DNA gyrase inhibitor YacG [Thiotrichaceae bacterium]PCI14776.1 MAG: DNA gyrase inhibitor YacG [Thiotrichales bacterium]
MNVNCPTCKKKIEWSSSRSRPFCSERCQLIDLGKWSSEEHRIPGTTQINPDEETDIHDR